MKNQKMISLFLMSMILAIGCGSNRGTLTIVNTSLDAAKIELDGKKLTISPEQHLTQKELKQGIHKVKVGSNPAADIVIKKRRTTLVDLAGDNCFIVADYTDQYGEKGKGSVKVAEKFINKKSFTTSEKITSELGEKLPSNVKSHKKITRLHRIDCSWIDNDQAIIDAIANLP